MNKVESSIAILALLLLASGASASTFRCPPEEVSSNLSSYSTVFSGRAADVHSGRVKFEVARVWKGDLLDAITLRVTSPGLVFKKGENYLVYALAQKGQDFPLVQSCRTKKLAEAKEDLEILGAGFIPTRHDLPAPGQVRL